MAEITIELNVKAYKLFLQIEIGIREFTINEIKTTGITDWSAAFLHSKATTNLKELGKRIRESQLKPDFLDIYFYKVGQELKTNRKKGALVELAHPFYYLGWSEFNDLIRTEPTKGMIIKKLGKTEYDMLNVILETNNPIRNDVAHSRIITEQSLDMVQNSFIQLQTIIPGFLQLTKSQDTEENIDALIEKTRSAILESHENSKISDEEIMEIIALITKAINSFWLNTFNNEVIYFLQEYLNQLGELLIFREKMGGLLEILNWQKKNETLVMNLKSRLNEPQI